VRTIIDAADRSADNRPTSMPLRSHKLWPRTLAVLLGTLASVLVLEGFYRLLRVRSLSPTTHPSYVRHDPRLGWSYRPLVAERHETSEFDVDVRINSRGFRGREWEPKQSDRPRILVLGDSYAFGWGVEEEQRFSEVLERGSGGFEVLNAAVSGYSTVQELLLLEELVNDVRPDLVLCVFCGNDLFENGAPIVYGKHKPYFTVEAGRLELRGVPVPEPWIERASYFYRALAKRRWQSAFDRTQRDPDGEWLLVCDLYRAMKRVIGPVPLVVVSGEQRLAHLAAEESTIHHLDLRSVFSGADGPTMFPVDGHWTPLAHEEIAAALVPMLRRLIP
jgi:hypothetical protein